MQLALVSQRRALNVGPKQLQDQRKHQFLSALSQAHPSRSDTQHDYSSYRTSRFSLVGMQRRPLWEAAAVVVQEVLVKAQPETDV
jgi:hypothetical protein